MKKLILLYIALFCCFLSNASAQDSMYAVIGMNDSKLYADPSKTSSEIAELDLGELVRIVEEGEKYESVRLKDRQLHEFYWYKVETESQSGWVFGEAVFHIENEIKRNAIYFKSDINTMLSLHLVSQHAFHIKEVQQADSFSQDTLTEVKKSNSFHRQNFLVLIQKKTDNEKENVILEDKVHILKAGEAVNNYLTMPTFPFANHLEAAFIEGIFNKNIEHKTIKLFNHIWGLAEFEAFEIFKLKWDRENYIVSKVFYDDNKGE